MQRHPLAPDTDLSDPGLWLLLREKNVAAYSSVFGDHSHRHRSQRQPGDLYRHRGADQAGVCRRPISRIHRYCDFLRCPAAVDLFSSGFDPAGEIPGREENGMKFLSNKYSRVLSLVLLLQAGAYYAVAFRGERAPAASPLSSFPTMLGQWRMTLDAPIEKEVQDVLNADDTL